MDVLRCWSSTNLYFISQRKLKPDLAEQYSTVVDVYSENVKLQQREASDLPVLLNSIIKIAAKRDGPGQIFIRLSNEMDSEEEEYQPDYEGQLITRL